jgi:hypothetical protein
LTTGGEYVIIHWEVTMFSPRFISLVHCVLAALLVASCDDNGCKSKPPDETLPAYTRVIRDYDYLDRTYFDLARHDTLVENDLQPGDSITFIELWYANVAGGHWFYDAKRCSLFVDPTHRDNYVTEATAGVFMAFGWDSTMGSFFCNPTSHFVILDKPLPQMGAMGAFIRFLRPGESTERTIGSYASDTLYSTLKLILAPYAQPSYVTWNYVWRNVYSLGTHLDPDSLIVDVRQGTARFPIEIVDSMSAGENGISYISILGLDSNADGRIDARNPQLLDLDRGHLRIPISGTPFADERLHPPVPELYCTAWISERVIASKYFFAVKVH